MITLGYFIVVSICTTKQNLKEQFWNKYPEKLPKDRICREELMSNWDNLDLSWNAQDILGCILPNDPKQFALINACRFIQRPILHWETVHQEKQKLQKRQMSLLASVPTATSSQMSNTSTISSTSTSATFSSSKLFSMKANYRHSQLCQSSILEIIDPKTDFKGHSPSHENEELALGHTLKMIHVGANKMVLNANYFASVETQKEQFQYFQSLNMEGIRNGIVHLPRPITVCLNDHNINDGFKAILKSHQKYNHDTDNAYCTIETANHWGFIHDAPSHWVKEINTVFLRAVDDKGNIFKVSFDMKQVPGSLTGEALCEEIINQISQVKTVKNNAASAISEALLGSSHDDTHENQKITVDSSSKLQMK